MVCGGDVFCLDGECDKAQSGQSNDFAEAVSQLAALAAAGKDVVALNGVDVRAFTGQAKFCKKAAAGYSNCCKDSGWGQDIGLAKCSSDEKALAKAKSNKLTVSVGEFCSKKVLGVCLEKKRSYCQFDSKLAQIEVVVGLALTGVMMMRIRPAVVHGPAMMLVMILTLKPVRTLKRPAITLPVAKSVNPAAILTIMLIPGWINCLQP